MTLPEISVCAQEGHHLNGLGMMMQQYLEQNLSDFKRKVREGRRIRGSFTVEMEGGVVSTITFQGDRMEFVAEKLVASSLDLSQTFEQMLSPEEAGKEVLEAVDKYEYQDGSLFSVHLAMHKIPTYKAAAFDPDINQAWVLNMGYECLEDFDRDWKDIRDGRLSPEPKLNVAINSLFDPYDAPEGKSTGLIRVFAPYELNGKGSGEWDMVKNMYAHRCIQKWQQHCEDFTDKDILHAKPYTPLDISTKLINMVRGDWMVGRIAESNLFVNRPNPMLSQYKTPVEGLYLCGSTTHPHGFITFGPGYNALQVIAEDFGMDKWWVEI